MQPFGLCWKWVSTTTSLSDDLEGPGAVRSIVLSPSSNLQGAAYLKTAVRTLLEMGHMDVEDELLASLGDGGDHGEFLARAPDRQCHVCFACWCKASTTHIGVT